MLESYFTKVKEKLSSMPQKQLAGVLVVSVIAAALFMPLVTIGIGAVSGYAAKNLVNIMIRRNQYGILYVMLVQQRLVLF